MKRDMDLVRHVLLLVENAESAINLTDLVTVQYSLAMVGYHVDMMQSHGLLDASILKDFDGTITQGIVKGLTWDGCDYLDAIRNDGIYQQAKKAVSQTVGSTTMALFKDVAVALSKQAILGGLSISS